MRRCGSSLPNLRRERRFSSRSYKERNLKLPHWIECLNGSRMKWSLNSWRNTSCRSSKRPKSKDSLNWKILRSRWSLWATLTSINSFKVSVLRMLRSKFSNKRPTTRKKQSRKFTGTRAKKSKPSARSHRRRQKQNCKLSKKLMNFAPNFNFCSLMTLPVWICGRRKSSS